MPSDPGHDPWPRVIGQHRVKRQLIAAMRGGRLAHAYLFHGSEGVGKDAMALELARVLHCETGGEEACGVCPSCRQAAMLQHPDIHLIVALPVGRNEVADDPPLARVSDPELATIREQLRRKAENPYHRITVPRATIIKINSVRDIRRESSMSTSDRRRRVFVISEADRMGEAAANTLLKTLEEPPGNTMLILTSAHRESLPPTILSRCHHVRFDSLTEQDIADALIGRNGVDPPGAALLARLANGSYTRAVDLLQEDVPRQRQEVLAFVRHVLSASVLPMMRDVDRLAQGSDRAAVIRFLVLLLMWLRDALVLSSGGDIINIDQGDDLRRFVAKFPRADLVRSVREVERAISLVERNVYIKLALFQLAVHLKGCIAGEAAGAPVEPEYPPDEQ